MAALLAGLIKYIPLLGGLLDKFFPDSGKAAELKAQKELEEAKAFARGRISPRYLMQFVLVFVFGLFAVGLFACVFFPGAVPTPALGMFREVLKMGSDMLNSGSW